ncbi:MAG: L-seryl-tRNA(Sec) kinase [Trebouxia sp. A1-2]|nr:MAG: L-seryl-tRNA(Sec) kinase [Trebouxia sp. A1-2]
MFQPASGSASAPPVAPNSKKRKRRQQQQTSSAWVSGLPDSQLLQAPRIVGLDPGRKALFTAVVHSQPAADSLHRGRPCESKYDTLSWSCSRWQEASGIKHRLRKSELWLNRKPALKAALLDTPTAKVWSTDQFMLHIKHRLQHAPEAIAHFGDRRHRQLRWSTYIKRQQAYAAVCKAISNGSRDTVVAYGDASFSSSCCKGNPSTPTVSLRRQLGGRCRVYDTDEFRTSKLCCACRTPMKGMPLSVTERGRKDHGPESYSLARKYQAAYIQLYIRCPAEVALQRNASRSQHQGVPEAVMRRMERLFEVPDPQKHAWEANTIVLDGSRLEMNFASDEIWQQILGMWKDPVQPVADAATLEQTRQHGRAANELSLQHQLDLFCRKAVSEIVQQLKANKDLLLLLLL